MHSDPEAAAMSAQPSRSTLIADAADMIDWLLKEYVNAYSGIPVQWDQDQYDKADRLRETLEEAQ